jgi:hypothetical protein
VLLAGGVGGSGVEKESLKRRRGVGLFFTHTPSSSSTTMLTSRGVTRITRRAASSAQRAARLSTAAPALLKAALPKTAGTQRAPVARSANASAPAGTCLLVFPSNCEDVSSRWNEICSALVRD